MTQVVRSTFAFSFLSDLRTTFYEFRRWCEGRSEDLSTKLIRLVIEKPFSYSNFPQLLVSKPEREKKIRM